MFGANYKKDRKKSMDEYFSDISLDHFVDPPRPKLSNNYRIIKFMQLTNNSSILVPMIADNEGNIKFILFYCVKCDKWYKITTTIANIFTHLEKKHKIINDDKSNSNNQIVENNKKNNMENTIKDIIFHLKSFLILNGYSFSDIEDENLNSICNSRSRSSLVRTVEKLSNLTRQKIKSILENASIISLAVDEWRDRMKRRYLGVTATAIIDRQYRIFSLAHRPMMQAHCSAEIIKKHLMEILVEYNINNCIKCAVTDNGGAVPAAINDEPNDINNLKINRFPCICHLINLYAKTFHILMKNDLDEFLRVKNLFDTLCFIAYLENVYSRIKKSRAILKFDGHHYSIC